MPDCGFLVLIVGYNYSRYFNRIHAVGDVSLDIRVPFDNIDFLTFKLSHDGLNTYAFHTHTGTHAR